MSKRDSKIQDNLKEDKKGVAAVQNQLNDSYQSGVVDQLDNNKAIHTYNNRSR